MNVLKGKEQEAYLYMVRNYKKLLEGIEPRQLDSNKQCVGDHDLKQHTLYMLLEMEKMLETEVDALKFMRWLGFVQSTFFSLKIYTLNQLRLQVMYPFDKIFYSRNTSLKTNSL